jgi:integrase
MEKEIDDLISGTSKTISTLLRFLKDTGARGIEAMKLKWTDIDTEHKVVHITPAKGSNPRILPANQTLIGMLNSLPKNNNYVFQGKLKNLRKNFIRQRHRQTKKLNNPRLEQIHLHTLRHWKGTIEYHKTKDIIHVKYVLGHKTIESTMVYINIEQALFLEQDDQWTVKVSHNIQESTQLLEAGFEYITDQDNLKLYRKRK